MLRPWPSDPSVPSLTEVVSQPRSTLASNVPSLPDAAKPLAGQAHLLDSDSDCAIVESLAEVAVPNAGGLAGCGSPEYDVESLQDCPDSPAHSIRSLGPGTTEPGTSSCHPQDVLVEEESTTATSDSEMIESEEATTCSACCSMLSEQQRCLCHSPLLSHWQAPAPGSASSKQEATQLPDQARPGPQFTMITSHCNIITSVQPYSGPAPGSPIVSQFVFALSRFAHG